MSTKQDKKMSTQKVIDFHLHTFSSDGVLGPAELARRALVKGYAYLGLADHVDAATLFHNLSTSLMAAETLNGHLEGMFILPGVELTHVPPSAIAGLVEKARSLGASHVVVHGETVMEPVMPGTNMAAILAGADILAHPGLISDEEAALAAEKGVFLEISSRGSHGISNGHVVKMAKKHKAPLLINSDTHAPGDLLTPEHQRKVALSAGLAEDEYQEIMGRAKELAEFFYARARSPKHTVI